MTLTRWDPNQLNATESDQYDAFGRLTAVTDSRGNTRHTEYDRLGRQIATIDALNARQSTTYDAFSRTLTTTDAYNNVTSYSYDDTERSFVVTTPEGVQVKTIHNRYGQTLSVTAARNTTNYVYDANGALQTVSDNLGTLESRTYDAAGRQLTDTDGRGVVTTFTYDAANRVFTRTVDSAAGGLALKTTYTYDGEGRVTRVVEPNGKVTDTAYDRDGRVSLVTVDATGLNLRTKYDHDFAGHVVTLTEGYGSSNPRVTQYVYDVLGRRTDEYVDPTVLGGTLNLHTQYKYDANGNVTRKIEANGNSIWYVYDADDQRRYTIDALGGVTENVYDLEGRVVSTRKYATPISTAAFGDQVTSVSVTADNTVDRFEQTVYDRDGRDVYSIDALGGVIERTFDATGKVTRQRMYAIAVPVATYSSPATVAAALQNSGNDTSTVSPNDRVNYTVYDARGRAEFTIDGAGAVIRNQYDGDGNVVTRTAFATARTTGAMDLATLQTWATANATNAQNRVTRYWYDGADREVYRLDGEGYLSETRYDDAGRRELEILYATASAIPAGVTTAQVKNRTGGVVITTGAQDQTTTTQYDAAGRAVRITDAAGNVQLKSYDAVGNLVTSVDQRGVELAERDTTWAQAERVRLGFPATASSLTASQQSDLRARYTTTYGYDAAGRQISITDPLGNMTRKGYDAAGNLIKLIDPRGSTGFYYYDTLGQVRYQIDPMGYVTERRYNALGSVTREVSYAIALSGTYQESTSLADIASRLGTEVVTRDRVISRTFDTRGLVSEIGYEGTTRYTETFHYNAFAQKTEYKDRNDARFNYEYDSRGLLAKELSPTVDVVTAVLPSVVIQQTRIVTTYEHDAFGEVSVKHEAVGLPQERATQYGYTRLGQQNHIQGPALAVYGAASPTTAPVTDKVYDAAGNVVQETAPDGGITLNYYDALNRRVASVDADKALHEFDYDAVGNVVAERPLTTTVSRLR